ncbi:hypothetical protein AKJ16_DCAP10902, partial [Drosera capensis]
MSIKHLLFSVFSGSNSDGQDVIVVPVRCCRWSNPLLVGAAEAFAVEVNFSGHRALVMLSLGIGLMPWRLTQRGEPLHLLGRLLRHFAYQVSAVLFLGLFGGTFLGPRFVI